MKFYISKRRVSTTIANTLFAVTIVFCAFFYLMISQVKGVMNICEYVLLPVLACALYLVAILLLGKKFPGFSLLPMIISFAYLILMAKQSSVGDIAFILTIVLYIAVFVVYIMTMCGVFRINARLICRISFTLPLLYRIVTAIYICAFINKDNLIFQSHLMQNIAPYLIEILILTAIWCTTFSLRHKRISHHHSSKEKDTAEETSAE